LDVRWNIQVRLGSNYEMKLRPSLLSVALLFVTGISASGQESQGLKPSATNRTGKQAKPITISCSFCVDGAVSSPKPEYPKTARYVNAAGPVSVEILIDERGNVISAKAVSGHPLLRPASVKAALKAKFPPTYIDRKPARVRTTIVYNYVK